MKLVGSLKSDVVTLIQEQLNAMPLTLVLVRHGQSEGNVASRCSKHGDDTLFTPQFLERPSSQWRLTSRGVYQAQCAGDFLRESGYWDCKRLYTSWYLRARETAAHLGLDGYWFMHPYLRERDWGIADVMSVAMRNELYAEYERRRKIDPLHTSFPGGESIAQMLVRLSLMLNTLSRECANERVLMTLHGDAMWGFRILLERLTPEMYQDLNNSNAPTDRIHNCQVVIYSRVDPTSGEIYPYFRYRRSVCPWDREISSDVWMPIDRPRFDNDSLLRDVENVPRIIDEV